MGGASTLTYNERFSIAMSNAKREFDEVSGFCDYFSARVKDLEAENAKLRELVNDMWICISHGSEGWDCTGCKRDPDSVCIMGICEFSQRMHELGIEVD